MKISNAEYAKAASEGPAPEQKILPAARPRGKAQRSAVAKAHLTPLEQGIATAEQALKDVPDVREDIVAELKERAERGQYQASGEEIAEMMIRRLRADRIR